MVIIHQNKPEESMLLKILYVLQSLLTFWDHHTLWFGNARKSQSFFR